MTVIVTLHALERSQQRFAELRRFGRQELADVVRREVLLAIAQGRSSDRKPSFLGGGSHVSAAFHPPRRFVWTPDERRVYVLRSHRSSLFARRGYLVVTVINHELVESAA